MGVGMNAVLPDIRRRGERETGKQGRQMRNAGYGLLATGCRLNQSQHDQINQRRRQRSSRGGENVRAEGHRADREEMLPQCGQ